MSTIIIRLQNLPLSAKAADIREFFGDLKIPKGSVNIVGGHLGDAFIGFASDEDARLAMLLDGRLLHNSKIRLMLSSKREMDQVISGAQSNAGKVPSVESSQTNPPDPSQKESVKLEALPAFSSFTQQPPVSSAFPTQTNLLEQQTSSTLPQIQQTFSGDSWKTPNYPPTTNNQTNLLGNTQLLQQTNKQTSPIFEGGGVPPYGQQQQHQYQQLLQFFPSQICQAPPTPQFRVKTPSQQQSNQFRPSYGTDNNFYNSQQQNTRFLNTQTGQQTFYGNVPSLKQFKNTLPGQQQQRTQFTQRGQQYGRGGGHQTFGGQRPQGQRFFNYDRSVDKRRRSRSPPNEQRKRFNIASNTENENYTSSFNEKTTRSEYGKKRFCVQLSNVPYKAAFNNINEYLSKSRAACIKVTRVYIPDKNYTDRWIVEFDNEENSRALIKYRGEIFGRTIRAERIPPRRADEQYAVAEPDERDLGRGRRREVVRRERSRSRNSSLDRKGNEINENVSIFKLKIRKYRDVPFS
ncbi:RRM domain-containing protein [Meloidogyne graminicola]|uniref:RRM domain-containing protein n=1 Tax=Meloidogyne graminicola TaxID=189291 RepID=A0A8S9ZSR1_9BILA|nr:RRM domain-containing protein [Meloidogyne graminicola]